MTPEYLHVKLTGAFRGTEFTERISLGVFQLAPLEGLAGVHYAQVPEPKALTKEQREKIVSLELDIDNDRALKIFNELDERLPATDGE